MPDVILPVQKSSQDMSKFDYDFKVSYYPESDEAKFPYKATPDVASYDLYAAKNKDVLLTSNTIVFLDLRWTIPKGFFRKVFSRSGLFLNHKITAEAGVIDSGYREIVQMLLLNISDDVFSVKLGQ